MARIREWTDEETAVVLKHYAVSGAIGTRLFLPTRTEAQIVARAAWLKRKSGYRRQLMWDATGPTVDDMDYPLVPLHIRVSTRKQYYRSPVGGERA